VVFKKMLASMGAGGGSVETTLKTPSAYPGGVVEGIIDIKGGSVDQMIDYVAVGLVARVEIESGDSEYDSYVKFHEHRLTGSFKLDDGAAHQLPFQLQIPWETPVNVIGGMTLPKCFIGVRTELEIQRSVDKTDVDPLAVYALPAHEKLLAAFSDIGFRFKGADMEKGRVTGGSLPFYQEIEFYPPPQFAHNVNELEVTFVTRATEMDVILEIDKRGGFVSSGHDQISKFTVPFAQVDTFDWSGNLNHYIGQLTQRRGLFH
jgi:sporulation-control protein